jgi:hypothetical protein
MKFDDNKLIGLAKSMYFGSEMAPQKLPHLAKLFNKEELNNEERNNLIDFIDRYRTSQPRSMTTMKRELLNLIGFKSDSEYSYSTNTVSRVELEAIYNFVMSNLRGKN